MSIYSQIQKNIANYYKMLQEQFSVKYAKETLLGVGILLSLFVGWFLHSYYVKQREQKAFGALVEVMESFEKAQYSAMGSVEKLDKNGDAWQDSEVLIDALYKVNMGSYLAPYFLIFKSQILLERDGDIAGSLKMLQDALSQIPKNSEMYSLFDLKRIKMSLDSVDEKTRDEALKDLIALTKNEKSYSFEEASYLLGLYYLYLGHSDKARDVWKNMLKFTDKKLLLTSPWVKQVEEKLSAIDHG